MKFFCITNSTYRRHLILDWIESVGEDIIDGLTGFFEDIGDSIVDFATGIGEAFGDAFDEIGNALANSAFSWILDVIEFVADAITAIVEGVVQFVEMIVDLLSGKIDKFWGMAFEISHNLEFGAANENIKFETGFDLLVQAGISLKANYDLFGSGLLPEFESFTLKVGFVMKAYAYLNFEISGADTNKFSPSLQF